MIEKKVHQSLNTVPVSRSEISLCTIIVNIGGDTLGRLFLKSKYLRGSQGRKQWQDGLSCLE